MKSLGGILPALITPLDADGQFDEASCRRVVSWTLEGGVHGVLALGSTGEMAALNTETRGRVVEVVTETVRGRVPVLVGIARTAVADAAADLESSARAGASAAVVAPPFYGPLGQRGVSNFYRRLREASSIPLVAYNIPAFTKVVLPPDTVAELAADRTIVGLKESSRDFEYFQQVLGLTRAVAGFALFTGSDSMLVPSLLMGGAGGITLCANLVPNTLVRIYDAARAGRWADAVADQVLLSKLVGLLRVGTFPAGIKAALSFLDLCRSATAAPNEALSAGEAVRLRNDLAQLGVLGKKGVPARAEDAQPLIPPAAMPRTS